MWTGIATLLGLIALEVITSPANNSAGPGRFAQAVSTVGKGITWWTSASKPAIPNLKAATSSSSTSTSTPSQQALSNAAGNAPTPAKAAS